VSKNLKCYRISEKLKNISRKPTKSRTAKKLKECFMLTKINPFNLALPSPGSIIQRKTVDKPSFINKITSVTKSIFKGISLFFYGVLAGVGFGLMGCITGGAPHPTYIIISVIAGATIGTGLGIHFIYLYLKGESI
jgi:hypothetical protein